MNISFTVIISLVLNIVIDELCPSFSFICSTDEDWKQSTNGISNSVDQDLYLSHLSLFDLEKSINVVATLGR